MRSLRDGMCSAGRILALSQRGVMSLFSEVTFAVRRYWKSVVATSIVGALFGLAISMAFPVRSSVSHVATTRVYVLTEAGAHELRRQLRERNLYSAVGEILVEINPPENAIITSDAYTKARIPTYVGILGSDASVSVAAQSVDLDPGEVKSSLQLQQRSPANIVDVRVTAPTAPAARELIQQLTDQLTLRIAATEEGDSNVELLAVSLIDPSSATEDEPDPSIITEALVRDNPGWLLSGSLVRPVADAVVAELMVDLESESASAPTLSISSEMSGTASVAPGVDSSGQSNATPEVWVVRATSDNDPRAVALVEQAVSSLTFKMAGAMNAPGGNADRVVAGEPSIESVIRGPLPGRGSADRTLTNIALGALSGVVLGLLFAILRVNVAPVIRTPHQIARITGRSPYLVRKPDSTRATVQAHQDFLLIAMSLKSKFNAGTALCFASSSPHEHAIAVALGIAEAFEAINVRVCVVDLGTEIAPHTYVFTPSAAGGSFERDRELAVQFERSDPALPSQTHLGELQEEFTYVLIVGNDIGSSLTGLLAASQSEGVFVVSTYAITRLGNYAATVASVEQASITLLGTVVQDVPESECTNWRAHSIASHVPVG